jgi:hypothetical protein
MSPMVSVVASSAAMASSSRYLSESELQLKSTLKLNRQIKRDVLRIFMLFNTVLKIEFQIKG